MGNSLKLFTLLLFAFSSNAWADEIAASIDDTVARGADNCICGADEVYGPNMDCGDCSNYQWIRCPLFKRPIYGCYCLPGYVRAFAGGPCIPTKYCHLVCKPRYIWDTIDPSIYPIETPIVIQPIEISPISVDSVA